MEEQNSSSRLAGTGPAARTRTSLPLRPREIEIGRPNSGYLAAKARQWVPGLLGLAVLSFALGLASLAYQLILHQHIPFPSWREAGYLGAYPFLVGAVLLLPRESLPRAARARMVMEGLMILAAVAAFSWYFLLGPAFVREDGSLLPRLVDGAYAVWDLMLIGGLLLLSTHFRDVSLRRVVLLLTLAYTIIVICDSAHGYMVLHGLYAPAAPITVTRAIGYALVAAAAWAARSALAGNPSRNVLPSLNRDRPADMAHIWRYLLPYALVPAVVALMVYAAQIHVNAHLDAGVYLAGAVLMELVFIHQFLTYRELTAYSNRSARLETLAGADPVTGMPNHRSLVAELDRELTRSHRYHHPCTLLFFDLDHFKALNDSFGHRAGDTALREFAAVVRNALRNNDVLGRWGGEEFLAFLPETGIEAGTAVAERVRAAVAAHRFWAAGGAHLTCSIGVAIFPDDARDRDGLVESADQAMYTAKRLGRNQVRTASDPAMAMLGHAAGSNSPRDEASVAAMVEGFAALMQARDPHTAEHMDQVGALAVRLALTLGMDTSEAHLLGLAGRLHDIGEIAIPESTLEKQGPLTDEERELIHKHPAIGASVVSRVPALRMLAPLIRGHHESWDGQGYPDRLNGTGIPLGARVLAVADAYRALMVDHPFRDACDPAAALAEIRRCAGVQFDPDVVRALERVVLQSETMLADSAGVA